MGTTTLGIVYPDPTDNVDIPADMQALAEDVDALILARRPVAGVSATSSSSAISTTETVVSTAPSATYLANSAYLFVPFGGQTLSTSTGQAAWKVRKTSAAGTVLIEWPRTPVQGSALANQLGLEPRVFIVGASNVTTVLCLTAVATSGATVTHYGAAATPRGFRVEYLGRSADWSSYGAVTLS